jgi:hypothetical protein
MGIEPGPHLWEASALSTALPGHPYPGLGFLIDNIYVVFGDQVFQQLAGIPMGTNCAPLLANLFLYSYEAEFV